MPDTTEDEALILSEHMARVRSANAALASEQRAMQIADTAAYEVVTSEGWGITTNEYRLAQCQADEHARQCIEHLVWRGKAHACLTDDGYIVVQMLEEA